MEDMDARCFEDVCLCGDVKAAVCEGWEGFGEVRCERYATLSAWLYTLSLSAPFPLSMMLIWD